MSDSSLSMSGDGLAFGSINYSSLQDIEIVVIVLKEIAALLEEVYGIEEESLLDRIEQHEDKKMVYLMKSLLTERDKLLLEDGIDYLGNRRGQFINQSREVFYGLSPKAWIPEIRPERKSVGIPPPNRNSVFQDITYIDYDSCEDITLVVKVTKRLDRILRDQYCIRKFTLTSKVLVLPDCDLKRKTLSLIGVGAPVLEERGVNNLSHRDWYVKMARYVLYYLTEGDILNIESVSQQNVTSSNNLTESTFTIPAAAESFATYEMLNSTVPSSFTEQQGGGRGRFDTSTRMSEMPPTSPEHGRYPVGAGKYHPIITSPLSHSRKLSIEPIQMTDAQRAKKLRREIRLAERNGRIIKCCRNFLIALVVAGATLGLAYLLLRQFTNIV